ncbi:MAG: PAS domain-containing protein [Candidatus Hydrogenedens sp.]|nr:PAS domain-containing protein [Candidatus Hydrogenedens sp.]
MLEPQDSSRNLETRRVGSYAVRESAAVRFEWLLLIVRYAAYGALLGAYAVGQITEYTPNLFFVTIGALLQNAYCHYVFYTQRYWLFMRPWNLMIHLAKLSLLVALTGGEDSPLAILYPLVVVGYSMYSSTMSRIWSVVWLTAASAAAAILTNWWIDGVDTTYPVSMGFAAILGTGYVMDQFARMLRTAEQDAGDQALALRTSESTLRGILDNTASPIVVFEDNELVVDANEPACEMLGCPRDQLIGRRFRAFLFDDGTMPQKLAALRAKGHFHGEVLLLTGAEKDISVDLVVRSFIRDDRRFHVAMLHDVSAQKEFQENSRAAQERLERLNRELKDFNEIRLDFYRRVAQRIRSPLSAILGYDDLLLNEEAGPISPEQRQALQESRSAARSLLSEIDKAFDAERRPAEKPATARAKAE